MPLARLFIFCIAFAFLPYCVLWLVKYLFACQKKFQKPVKMLMFLFLLSSVYLISNVWWRPCDGRGLSHSPPSENWYQSPWQCWRLPGQSSCSLEPRDRYGACTQTGWHRFNAVYFILDRLANAQTEAHECAHTQKHICSQGNSWH